MRYLLDTNTCIEFLRQRDSRVKDRLTQTDFSAVVLCTVVKAELYYGAYKSQQREMNLQRLRRFFSQFESLPFADAAAETYGRLRAGQRIGPNDLLIAAIALAHEVTLVTHNAQEFARVPGLTWEDWQA